MTASHPNRSCCVRFPACLAPMGRGCAVALAVGVAVPDAAAAPAAVVTAAPEHRPPRLLGQVAPVYPGDAPEGAHGDVSVQVMVDAGGRVGDAEVAAGPSVFHQAALDAAGRLRFAPGEVDGSPVAMSVLVRFHFAPPVVARDDHSSGVEIVVSARDADATDTHARQTLDQAHLDRSAGEDLATTVATVAGVVAAGCRLRPGPWGRSGPSRQR